jgi:hypothetical protein
VAEAVRQEPKWGYRACALYEILALFREEIVSGIPDSNRW